MSRSGRVIAAIVVAGYVLLPGNSTLAQGFREQHAWQFRSAAETQVKLNIESTRLQINGIGSRGVSGGGTTIGLGAALDPPGSGQTSSSTTANATSGTTNYNVSITGDRNDVKVDGYLNLDVAQDSAGLKSKIRNR